MLKLRELFEKSNGHGLKITNWEKLDSYLEKELSVFLDYSIVANTGEFSEIAQQWSKTETKMYYKIVKFGTWECLVRSEYYNGVAWVESDRTHKYHEDSFWFTFEELEELILNGLLKDDVEIYCFDA